VPTFAPALCGAAATVCAPSHCWAAGQAILPWDYSLEVTQNFVAGSLAHSVIVISGIVATLAFALAGDSELARRLVKTVIGTGVALLAVQLLNYLAS
jgi:type IV secretory pathway VirB2 component (pilin)